MESRFFLKATDRQAQALFDSTLATVKLIEFLGDKELYPDLDMSSGIVHKWRVILRHRDEIGKIKGTRTYNSITALLTGRNN